MVLVDDEVADGEVGAGAYALGGGFLPGGLPALFVAARDYLRVGEHGEADGGVFEPGREPAGGYDAAARGRDFREPLRDGALHAALAEVFAQKPRAAHIAREHDDGIARAAVGRQVLRGLGGAAGVAGQLLRADGDYALRAYGVAPGGEGVRHIQRHGPQAAHGGVEGRPTVK